MARASIYLVPGFFGFAHLGELHYFAHVRSFLQRRLAELGIDAVVRDVPSRPTASLVARAATLADVLAEDTGEGAVHLVGHSSGGLDARLLALPCSVLPTTADLPAIRRRIASIVTVATPHRGTPVATFFCTLYGRELLKLVSLAAVYVVRRGQLPRAMLLGVAAALGTGRVRGTLVEQLYSDLLSDFDAGRRAEVDAFFRDVWDDPSLMVQIRPEGIELLNALGWVPPEIACGSVVIAARKPGLGAVREAGLSATQQASLQTYRYLYLLARFDRARGRLSPAERAALRPYGAAFLDPDANDGMVPTASMVWGKVLTAARADHLDVLGHFADPDADPPHYDWLFSGSGFRRPQFERVWGAVAAFLAESHRARSG